MNKILLLIICSVFLLACGSKKKDAVELKRTYSVAKQQLPDPQVYYPGRWVRAPRPPKDKDHRKAKLAKQKILPKFYYDLKNSTVCDAGIALANSMQYSFYCSSLLKNQRYSRQVLASPLEFAQIVKEEAMINLVIDELNREIRFLKNEAVVPRYINEY